MVRSNFLNNRIKQSVWPFLGIDKLAKQIKKNEIQIKDHETRITALENSSGGA